MIELSIVVIAGTVLIVLAVRANSRFAHVAALPMQWSLTGKVNWTAPRRVALAFIPALAICTLVATAVAMLAIGPRPGQEDTELPVLLAMSVGFVALYLLHIGLIGRSLRRH